MFNALNSLSENQSIFQMPPWRNMWLIYAIMLSFILHFTILYLPFLQLIFNVAPLNYEEWKFVIYLSFPIIIIDELLKLLSRAGFGREGTPTHDATAALTINTSLAFCVARKSTSHEKSH